MKLQCLQKLLRPFSKLDRPTWTDKSSGITKFVKMKAENILEMNIAQALVINLFIM